MSLTKFILLLIYAVYSLLHAYNHTYNNDYKDLLPVDQSASFIRLFSASRDLPLIIQRFS